MYYMVKNKNKYKIGDYIYVKYYYNYEVIGRVVDIQYMNDPKNTNCSSKYEVKYKHLFFKQRPQFLFNNSGVGKFRINSIACKDAIVLSKKSIKAYKILFEE